MPWDPHPGLSPLSELCRCHPAIDVPLVTAGLASLSQPPWPALLPAAMAGPAQSPPQDQGSLGHWGLSVWGAATPLPAARGWKPEHPGQEVLAVLTLVREQVLLAGDCLAGLLLVPRRPQASSGYGW